MNDPEPDASASEKSTVKTGDGGNGNGNDRSESARVLIADDTELNIVILSSTLRQQGYRIDVARDGAEALRMVRETHPDLVLLDVMMPEMNGFEVCEHLNADPATADIPVIFLTSLTETDEVLKGFEMGAVDFVNKPFKPAELVRRVQTHLELSELRHNLEHLVVERTAELAVAMEKAEAASRAKSVFLATMSHELRTPLNHIIGYTEMLQEEAEDSGQEDLLPDLEKIDAAGKNLLTLVADVLEISSVETGETEPAIEAFEVTELVETAVEAIRPEAEKNGNRLELVTGKEIASMRSDRERLRRCLGHLLSNAAKFTRNGEIRVEAERRRRKGIDGVEFRVRDTGIGIETDQLGTIFEPFTQADDSSTREQDGSGLGLAVTKRFCDTLRGDLAVESTPGEGSTFSMWVPDEGE